MTEQEYVSMRMACLHLALDFQVGNYDLMSCRPTAEDLIEAATKLENYLMARSSVG